MTALLENMDTLKATDPATVHLIPFGGVGEFGMNFMGYYHQDRLFIVDCGMAFADPTKLGIDIIVPQVDQWLTALGGVHSYFMTHGHEDHIGALPYLIERWPAPIYATAWTAVLLREKWLKHGISLQDHPITVVSPGDKVTSDNIEFEWVHVNHSIPMTCSVVISTPGNRIYHTGDFKFDLTPVGEDAVDLSYLAKLGEKGIDLLVADSTNATHPGFSPSESIVAPALEEEMRRATGTIFLSTFASNFWRLKSAIAVCEKLGKRIFIAGSGMSRTLGVAEELGMGNFPKGLFIDEVGLSRVERDKLVVLATGCQGEHRAALSRIIHGEHPLLTLRAGDTVIFSSRMVPGNERSVLHMKSMCAKIGAHIVSSRSNENVHVSGHAYSGELTQLIDLLKPKNYLPVHGTFTQLTANLQLGDGKSTECVVGVENGQIVKLTRGSAEVVGNIRTERNFVDSWSRIPMEYPTLRDRLKIGDSGLAIVNGVYAKAKSEWVVPVEFEFIGLQFPRKLNFDEWLERAQERVHRQVQREFSAGVSSSEELNEACRIVLRRELTAIFVKKPVVIPKIHFL